jgi:hypothetical protein
MTKLYSCVAFLGLLQSALWSHEAAVPHAHVDESNRQVFWFIALAMAGLFLGRKILSRK